MRRGQGRYKEARDEYLSVLRRLRQMEVDEIIQLAYGARTHRYRCQCFWCKELSEATYGHTDDILCTCRVHIASGIANGPSPDECSVYLRQHPVDSPFPDNMTDEEKETDITIWEAPDARA